MNLKERLQLKAARDGHKTGERFFAQFLDGHASTHEMIAKLAGALEVIGTPLHRTKDYEGLCVAHSKVAQQALQELEKWWGEA